MGLGDFFANLFCRAKPTPHSGDQDSVYWRDVWLREFADESKFEKINSKAEIPESMRALDLVLGVMAEPGGDWEPSCIRSPDGPPGSRLCNAGVNKEYCYILIERGGEYHARILKLFSISTDSPKKVWEYYIPNLHTSSHAALRDALGRMEQFKEMFG